MTDSRSPSNLNTPFFSAVDQVISVDDFTRLDKDKQRAALSTADSNIRNLSPDNQRRVYDLVKLNLLVIEENKLHAIGMLRQFLNTYPQWCEEALDDLEMLALDSGLWHSRSIYIGVLTLLVLKANLGAFERTLGIAEKLQAHQVDGIRDIGLELANSLISQYDETVQSLKDDGGKMGLIA